MIEVHEVREMGMSVQKVGVANKEYEPGLSVSSCEFVLALLMSLEPYVLSIWEFLELKVGVSIL